jgi:Nif-specific regulatory protein
MDQNALTTGVESLDSLIGGLVPGDNIVWEGDSGAPVDSFTAAFLRTTKEGHRNLLFVSLNRSPQAVVKKYREHISLERFFLLDCFTSGKGRDDKIFSDFYGEGLPEHARVKAVHLSEAADPDRVRQAIEALESQAGEESYYVFDSLTGMLELWGDERKVLNFFAYMCPRLYDLNTIAYWMLEKEAHSEKFLANLRHITQVVVELSVPNGRPTLLLRKTEGRRSPRIGIPQALRIINGTVEVAPERREELEVAILSEVSQSIGGAMNLAKVFEQTMGTLARELKMRRGTLVLLDKATEDLKTVAAHGLSAEEKRRGRYKVGEGVTGKVVQSGQPAVIADITKDPSFLNRSFARTGRAKAQVSFVCVPLRVDNEVVGAISIDRDYVDEETLAKDQRLLEIIASLLSQAIKINRMMAVEREKLIEENLRLRRDLISRYEFGNIVAASRGMEEVVASAATVAKSNATVLIRGETGTGKELVASVLHYNSNRADAPFVKVNCGGLPEGLLESELFGHERGAFTGAVRERKGRFELADKGTVFLDEVGAMSGHLQAKLLRVLQEREFERVGGTETIKVDVRVVAATNADLEDLVAKGMFREDLFYRLNVIPIFIPPLRERREDIPLLVEHFLEKYNRECGKNVSKMSQEVLDVLMEYPWPGNVRELESCIERAVVLSKSDTLSMDILPINIRTFQDRRRPCEALGSLEEVIPELVRRLRKERRGATPNLYDRILSQVERALIVQALEQNDHVQLRAARELGLSRNTLRKKMQEYGISSH